MFGRRDQGKAREKQAERFLSKQGLQPLQRNFHSRYGEIDLIMLDAKTLCFIEVKFRSGRDFGGVSASISASKQHKIIKTAQVYLSKNAKFNQAPCRFDAVLIEAGGSGQADRIEWIKSAFDAS